MLCPTIVRTFALCHSSKVPGIAQRPPLSQYHRDSLLGTSLCSIRRTIMNHGTPTSSSRQSRNTFGPKCTNTDPLFPSMIVFDLDDCLWRPEMHELPGLPEIPIHGPLGTYGEGVVGLQVACHRTTVRLHDQALQVLQDLATNPAYQGIVLATASSSLEPSYSYACLEGLEILPGLTMGEMMSFNEIGRTGHLSPKKSTHFTHLHQESRIAYEEMLFFDDCNWGDHCGLVSKQFGVVSRRTPEGLDVHHFQEALQEYRRVAETRKHN